MNPGRLNKRIKILNYAEDSDGAGGFVDEFNTGEGWNTVATVWAEVYPLRGKALIEAQQGQSETTHKVTIRFRADINKSHVIKYDGRRLEIESIINIGEKNSYLELMCVERI